MMLEQDTCYDYIQGLNKEQNLDQVDQNEPYVHDLDNDPYPVGTRIDKHCHIRFQNPPDSHHEYYMNSSYILYNTIKIYLNLNILLITK